MGGSQVLSGGGGEGISKGALAERGAHQKGRQASCAMLGGVDGFCLDIHMASPLWTRYRQVGKVCTEEAVARLQTLSGWLELSAGTGLKGHWAV